MAGRMAARGVDQLWFWLSLAAVALPAAGPQGVWKHKRLQLILEAGLSLLPPHPQNSPSLEEQDAEGGQMTTYPFLKYALYDPKCIV